MNIVFLDIDGVLNSTLFVKEEYERLGRMVRPHEMLDPKAIGLLNSLLYETDAKVVISSSWKRSWKIDKLRNHLEDYGFTGEIIDYTPDMDTKIHTDGYNSANRTPRGVEIMEWIMNNEEVYGKHYIDFNEYVILDDDSDMLLSQYDNYFRVDRYIGLTPDVVHRAKIKLIGINKM